MQKMVVVVPVESDVDKGEHIGEQQRNAAAQIDKGAAGRHLELTMIVMMIATTHW
ncbi:hypothetical protein FHT02_001035 [Sphingomonas xinjiangensis]|uniref:Uncharacterized protein n=1 Tax=Sphingomonas xinjiangensis TaxID=643568 RepID=A0A840YPW7_9SPHN|nr:hypothetical protein [Sphingomonas xinjiangensis]